MANGTCTHEQAMSIINATSRVVKLSYEDAVVAYLRARRILKDSAEYLAAPIPSDWVPITEIPKTVQEVIAENDAIVAKNEKIERTTENFNLV
jgi:hypothetical protein